MLQKTRAFLRVTVQEKLPVMSVYSVPSVSSASAAQQNTFDACLSVGITYTPVSGDTVSLAPIFSSICCFALFFGLVDLMLARCLVSLPLDVAGDGARYCLSFLHRLAKGCLSSARCLLPQSLFELAG